MRGIQFPIPSRQIDEAIMQLISTKTHAVNDYIVGAMLIAVPVIISERRDAAFWIPVLIGAILLVQSLVTAYELSIAKIIPVKVHLVLDVVAGVVLAASPWLFGFYEEVWVPHVIVGLADIVLAMLTSPQPSVNEYRTGSAGQMASHGAP